jgi:DNA-binding YbaB/EbfC family protein
MTINPFDLLKNAQKIQEQMGTLQDKLGAMQVTGSAGGGMVEVDMNGRMEVLAIRIAPEAVDPKDVQILQDLIKAGFTDASEKAKEAIRIEMGAMAGGLGLPPGFPGLG